MDIAKKILNGMDDETWAQVQACESAADLVALAKERGVELSDEQMEAISGGSFWEDGLECDDFGCAMGGYV